MAIDTAQKRRSAAGVPFLPLGPAVTPDSAKDQAWRQEVAWSYSGIAAVTLAGGFSIAFARESVVGRIAADRVTAAFARESITRIFQRDDIDIHVARET